MSGAPPAAPAGAVPGVWRRLACFVYEGVLLFGVVMLAGLAYGVATDQRHALAGQQGLQALLFAVLGLYFAGFWVRGGQTLAMKTWHIRLVGPGGAPPGWGRALLRYLLAWLWFAPALAVLWFSGARGGGISVLALAVGVAVYALLARLHPSRQFLHDLLAGTRLETHRPAPAAARHNAAR